MKPTPEAEEPWCPVIDPETFDWEEHERFVAQFANDRQLSGKELAALAQRLADATDPAEREALREAFTRGWYGGVIDAENSPPAS